MALQVLLHLLLAFIWMFLNNQWDLPAFIIGYFIGLGLLYLFRGFFHSGFYFRKVLAVLYLVLLFLKELVLSSLNVLKLLLRPKLDFQPGIFALQTKLKSDWEISLLASLITMTPGTVTVDVSQDGEILYIHAMDLPNVEEAILQIQNSFEKAIMEVTR